MKKLLHFCTKIKSLLYFLYLTDITNCINIYVRYYNWLFLPAFQSPIPFQTKSQIARGINHNIHSGLNTKGIENIYFNNEYVLKNINPQDKEVQKSLEEWGAQ